MSNYSDPAENFKLIEAARVAGVSVRNTRIFSMLLNQLGIDNTFHEFILGLMAAENWDLVEGMREVPYKRIARKLSADDGPIFQKVYERIRKNKLLFFKWQENQSFTFIETETTTDHSWPRKTYTSYNFPYYQVVLKLFNLPEEMTEKQIRSRVYQEAIKIMGHAIPTKTRRGRRRKPESLARSIRKMINDLVEETGSLEQAILYVLEADQASEEGITIRALAHALVKSKGLTAPPCGENFPPGSVP